MYRKLYILLIAAVCGTTSAQAQEPSGTINPSSSSFIFDNFFFFAWDVTTPTGEKYVDDFSFAGGTIGYRKMMDNNWSIGLDLSWNSYAEYLPYQTFHLNSQADITTDLYKYNYTLPMAVTLHNYFPVNGSFIPYAGLGVGAVYCRPSLFFNIYELYEENWGFLVRPEIGALIKFDPAGTAGLLVGVRYSYSTNQEEGFRIDDLQALGFNLGLCWSY